MVHVCHLSVNVVQGYASSFFILPLHSPPLSPFFLLPFPPFFVNILSQTGKKNRRL